MQPQAKNGAPREATPQEAHQPDQVTPQNLPWPPASADPRDAYEQTDQLARRLEG